MTRAEWLAAYGNGVPDLKGPDDFWAQWNAEDGLARVHQPALGESITLSPSEIRRLYAWIEEHKLT